MIYNKISKKGFTLMELLVTVILVAILASYGVYYYTNTMREGNLNAAKGKLAGLGGAVERFKIEYGDSTLGSPLQITAATMSGTCNYYSEDTEVKMYSIFRCGYVEKSLGIDDNFDFYLGAPSAGICGGSGNSTTAFMTPKDSSIDLYPAIMEAN